MEADEILEIVKAFFEAILKVFDALKALFGTVNEGEGTQTE